MKIKIIGTMAIVTSMIFGCGGRRHDSGGDVATTPIEQAFVKSASENNIPVRLMMAAGFLESGLRSERSSVNYMVDGSPVSKRPTKGESAFGFSFAELGLPEGGEVDLTRQIEAYGRFLKTRLASNSIPARAVTAEEKIRWIWKLASLHRGEGSQRNLLAVFSREMMKVLNDGFNVQDIDGLVAHLEKEASPLRDQDLPDNFKQDLQLDMYHSDIRSGYLFSLARENPTVEVNHPKRVEVVHCPFTLSICIQLQESSAHDAAPFGAHYVIPSNDIAAPGILQFYHHDEVVSLVGPDGAPEIVKDRVIVMLAGSSGRYIGGQRNFADPMWMTDFQMRLLGAAINEICGVISRAEGVNRAQCQSIGGLGGVLFRTQPGEFYRWGDIADYDETIMNPYIANSDGISANTTLAVSPDAQQTAGGSFKLNAGFQSTARRIELERLVRCPAPDRRVIWEPVDQRQVRNVSSHSFENAWYDAGPNGTGDQFFRVKASGEAGKFLGWSTKRVQLRGFEKNTVPEAPSKYCLRNGT